MTHGSNLALYHLDFRMLYSPPERMGLIMKYFLGWTILGLACLAFCLSCETSGDTGRNTRYFEGDSAESNGDDTDTTGSREEESDAKPSDDERGSEDSESQSEDNDPPLGSDIAVDTDTSEDTLESESATEEPEQEMDTESEEEVSTTPEPDTATEELSDTASDFPVTDDLAIFPLAKGNVWTYTVTSLASNTVCRAGTSSSKIDLSAIELGKYRTYRFSGFCKRFGSQAQYDFLYPKGDRVINYDTKDVITDAPVAEGHTWQVNSSVSVQWEFADTVTVPAGTFDHCWNRVPLEQNSDTPISTYCRGIGPIKIVWPGRTEAVLTSYTVN